MPVTESAEYAKFNTIGLTKRPDSIQAEGRIRYLNDVVTLVGDETTGSVSLLPVPKGCLIDPAKSFFITSATTGKVVDLGVNGVVDNIADGISVTSAGTKTCNPNATALVEATTGEVALKFVSGSASASTLRVSIAYYVR
tara:strand:+ start:1896 stop:2315 length:420 start_codon:yes stop_codon:yes gene_type:complete